MSRPPTTVARPFRARLRGLLARLGLVAASVGIFAVGAELLLRVFPRLLPAGTYHGSGFHDPDLGFHLPDAPVLYDNVRFTRRVPNRDGMMDVDHAADKPPDVVRVGFFGDSYVAAVQVPLEEVFFRRLPPTVGGKRIETFGFGVPGLGTLHSLLMYRKFGPRYDLDVVVHLFVHNDAGDNAFAIQRRFQNRYMMRPSAVLAPGDPGFEIEWGSPPSATPWTVRLARRLKSDSYLARLLFVRLQLLSLQARQARQESDETVAAESSPVTLPGDPPSTWPPPLLADARELTRHLLAQLDREVRADGRRFLVLYVPLGNEELDGRVPETDRWLPWLAATCADLGISLVDPSDALRCRLEAGDPVYDDHWSPAGHEVVAGVLADALEGVVESAGSHGSQTGG